jgi:hypothetical protein
MSVCPNINLKEWKALEASVGKFEAYRDFMETNGEIRTSEEVQAKINSREQQTEESLLSEDVSLADLHSHLNVNREESYRPLDAQQIKRTRAVEFANKVSSALGVDYQVITPEEAMLITKGAKNPWAGEGAFFVGGKVYFLQDRMSSDMVLHEFAHPLVRSIAKENPQLLNNLFESVIGTNEGQVILQAVKRDYTALTYGTDLFKEEVIVKALEKAGMKSLSQEKIKGSFGEVIKDIIYQIKQLLRRAFGRGIKVSKISPKTTINELANILTKGGVIEINTELISEEDIVAYNKEAYNEVSADLDNVRNKDIQNTIDTFYDVVTDHIGELMRNKNYNELSRLLMDENQRGDLQSIKSNLSQWQTSIRNKAESVLDDANQSRSRVEALTNSLFRLEDIMQKIFDHVEDISGYPDTQDNMHKAYYYAKLIDHWAKFINEVESSINDPKNNVPSRSPVTALVADIKKNMTQSKNIINDMYAKGARDTVYEQLEPLNRNISARYEQMIANARKRGAGKARIDSIYKEYHGMNQEQHGKYLQLLKGRKNDTLNSQQELELAQLGTLAKQGLSISKDKIELLLQGNMGDANWFNSYLEGYLYNTDPIVGGLALFIKNQMNEVMIVTQQKSLAFAQDLQPSISKLGLNQSNVGGLGEKVGFRDTIGQRDPETGELKEKQVWTFLNPYKNYRYSVQFHRKAVEDAHLQYQMSNEDDDRTALTTAIAEQKKFLRTYFHQEYVDEFYEREQEFEKDDIGKEAAYRRGELFEEMRMLTEPAKTQLEELDITTAIDELWKKYKQMHSRYDLNGNLKEGEDADIAKRLRSYRDKSRDFYEFKIRKGVFENAYFDFLQELRGQGIKENSDEWVNRIEQWKKKNTRVTVKEEFYDSRTDLLLEIEAIMKKLDPKDKAKVDQSEAWTRIFELTAGFRDNDGQPKGGELSEGSIDEIRDLQYELEEIKKAGVRRSGLNREDAEELSELFAAHRRKEAVDWNRIRELQKLKTEQALSEADSLQLDSLYAELAEMSSKEATDYYVQIMANHLSRMTDTSMLDGQFQKGLFQLDKQTADILLDPEVVDSLFDQDAGFEKWYTDNHILKDYWDKEAGEMKQRYERLYIWSIVKPADPEMMESYDIKDGDGKVVDTINGLPGMNYYARVVKEEYKTRNIQGITKDNQGQFLPKSRAEMSKNTELSAEEKYKFINEKYEAAQKDPNLMEVLDKLKAHHLQNQDGLSYSSRLYLDMPRYRKGNLEVLQSTNLIRATKNKGNLLSLWAQRAKDFIKGAKDDAEDGYSYDEKLNLTRADMFDNEMTDIPISGLYDIDVDDVSTDITQTMISYMGSAERQKQLIKMSPVVRAIQETVRNPANAVKSLNNVNKKNLLNRNILSFLPSKDKIREKAIDNLIEREFEGKTQTGLGADVPWLNNFAGLLFKRASFSFFALNIPSALKNSYGMKFQSMIEASGGRYVDHKSLQLGNAWAYKAMGQMSFTGELYQGDKSHMTQMMDGFDMIQGRAQDKLGEGMSRSIAKDAADFSWLYSFRKWVEIQAGVQLGAGMLYKQKVNRRMPDGTSKEIPYIDAFETVDGLLKLKDGVDVRYGMSPTLHKVKQGDSVESIAALYNISVDDIEQAFKGVDVQEKLDNVDDIEQDRAAELSEISLDGLNTTERLKATDRIDRINKSHDDKIAEIGMGGGTIKINNGEFKFMKNQMHQVANNMGGAYAKFDQPEAQRYLAFRFISYLRRYFTTMATNRWGFGGKISDPRPRLNPGLGDAQMGFYIQFGKTMIDIIRTGGTNLAHMTSDEKVAMLKFASEVLMLMATTLATSLFFGWDPEDDERYQKLRAKSGAMPFPFVGDNDKRPDFNLLGFTEVQTLHLLMQIRAENEQFNLLTGGIQQYNSLLDIKSVAFGPTTDSYVQLWDDLIKTLTGDPKAYYSREVGPYDWQDQGGSKFINHFGKTFGLTGSSLDPAMAVQNFQSYQSKVRR